MAAENVQTFTDSNFEETVMKSGQPVLVPGRLPLAHWEKLTMETPGPGEVSV